MDAFMVKFPQAKIHQWTREQEGDILVYDIEFEQEGLKFEADIKENGSIHNWEKAIEVNDLPDAVKMAADKKYPNSTIKEIMEITEVQGKDENLEGYEVVLETAQKREIEITIAPDGKILEDSEENKSE